MRVALCTKWIDESYSGVGLYVAQLLRALLDGQGESGIDLTLVHKSPPDDPLYGRAREVRFKSLPGPLWTFSQDRALRALQHDVDLVHEPYIGVRSKLSVPQVITVHDTIPLDFPAAVPWSFRTYFRV